MSSIFLSHSHKDKRFVARLARDLQDHGVRVWVDEAEMRVGVSLIAEVSKAIDRMDYLGVVLSPHSVDSEWVQRETRQALYEEIKSRTVKVLPILIAKCPIPSFLREKLYVDFRAGDEYDTSLNLLVRSINDEFASLGELEKAKRRAIASEDDDDVVRLMDAVDKHPFTRAWKTSLAVGVFSKKFLETYLSHALRMKDMTFELEDMQDPEYLLLAASMLAFFRDLRKVEAPTVESLAFCASVTESANVEVKWQKLALGTFLDLYERRESLESVAVPSLIGSDGPDRLLVELVTSPTSAEEHDSVDLLARLWSAHSRRGRTELSKAICEVVRAGSSEGAEAVRELGKSLVQAPTADDFAAVLANLRAGGNSDLEHREVLRALMVPGEVDVQAVVDVFRTASRHAAAGRFGLLEKEARRTLTQERVHLISHQKGRWFAYRLLSRIALDPGVHPMLAAIAMGLVANSESSQELEALLQEDDVPGAFFRRRVRDMLPSLVEFVCNDCEHGAAGRERPLFNVYLLEIMNMASSDDPELHRLLLRTVADHAGCRSLGLYQEYLRGETSFEDVESALSDR